MKGTSAPLSGGEERRSREEDLFVSFRSAYTTHRECILLETLLIGGSRVFFTAGILFQPTEASCVSCVFLVSHLAIVIVKSRPVKMEEE